MPRSASNFAFHGKTAHGAVDPWDGKDAVDAVELMDIGFDFLRQQLQPTYRAHRSITDGGIQPNIIPDFDQDLVVRARRQHAGGQGDLRQARQHRQGRGDLMTGTTHDVIYPASAWPQLVNKAMARGVQKNIDTVGMPKWTEEEQRFARDFQKAEEQAGRRPADERCPLGGQRPQSCVLERQRRYLLGRAGRWSDTFPASVPGIHYHEWMAAVTPTSTIAHKGEVAGAKVLADSVLDFMTSPDVSEGGACRNSSRTIKEDALFLAGAGWRKAGYRSQQGASWRNTVPR